MAFDFKKEYRAFYLPPMQPEIIQVPEMQFLCVAGRGDPNQENGAYQQAIGVLYALAYTIKMSKMGDHRIEGYYDFVVPPLEGLWWQDDTLQLDYTRKDLFVWEALIRAPDFVTNEDFEWATLEATKKKKVDCTQAKLVKMDAGLCVQCMHIGPYDEEPVTLAKMSSFMEQQGYVLDLNAHRRHHEIYLSDARKIAPEKWRTVIRLPVRPRRAGE